jgi:hypothetical protein
MSAWNRHPLCPNVLAELPPGSIRARGWLHEQLRLSASGLTGRLMDIWPDVGTDSGWLGGGGERWERGPYYVRGLLALAQALADAPLLARARPWIEWTLGSQREDGFFGPSDNDDWWPRMPMLEALRWHFEATGDARVAPFMTRYFQHQLDRLPHRPLDGWAKPRGGDNLDHVLWLYNLTGAPFLLDLADLLHRQTSDWLREFSMSHSTDYAFDFEFGHGVNRAMGLKEPAVYSQRSGDPSHLDLVRTGWERTVAGHGQIQGTYSCDEFLHGRDPTQGTEFCTIVELLSSFGTVLRIGGAAWAAEAMERIAYNALPAILTPDHRGHQYFQLANQIECTPGGRNFHVHHENDLLFGAVTGYGCCAANGPLGWPRVVAHLWMTSRDGGLIAPLFGPCAVTARLRGGALVTIVEDTDYPFDGNVRLTIRTASPVTFPLHVRRPVWAEGCMLEVNGEGCGYAADAPYVSLYREWRDGDVVTLEMPMPPRVTPWSDTAVAVERGPLVFALALGEAWQRVGGSDMFPDYEVHPTTAWNYGLCVHPGVGEDAIALVRGPLAAQPWAREGAPVRLLVPGRRIPGWTARNGVSGPLPVSPVTTEEPGELLTLVPFGCARLRIAVFPVLE